MQREEGFNTKMADGPDEYEAEAGCVPLLHPEVRDGAPHSPRPAAPQPSPPAARGAAACCLGGGTRRSWGGRGAIQARARLRADNGGGERGAGRGGLWDAVRGGARRTQVETLRGRVCRRAFHGSAGGEGLVRGGSRASSPYPAPRLWGEEEREWF